MPFPYNSVLWRFVSILALDFILRDIEPLANLDRHSKHKQAEKVFEKYLIIMI